jgi:hypothetical protein
VVLQRRLLMEVTERAFVAKHAAIARPLRAATM